MTPNDNRRYLRIAVEQMGCLCAAEHLETLDELLADNARLENECDALVRDLDEARGDLDGALSLND